MNRRLFVVAATGALATDWAAAQSGAAGAYPSRPIRFIVPYSPGGLGDSFARGLAAGLSERLGQPVTVENIPGASQAIGAAAAAKAPPDGYTLFMGTQSGLVLNSLVRKKPSFDAVKDFAPISQMFTSPLYLVAHPQVGVKTVNELIAVAKSKPGRITVATIGEGTSTNLASEMFERRAGVELLSVAYKGSAAAITDLVGGQVDLMFEGGASALPFVRQGKLRALAVTSPKRDERAAPGVPTMSESLPGFDFTVWFGVVGPAGMPKPLVDQLNREVAQVMRSPKLQELAETTGAKIEVSSPDAMGTRIRNELQEFAKVMKHVGMID